MNKYPKIIKRQQPTAPEATAAHPLPPVPSPTELIESVEVPTEPERLEALSVPPSPSTPTLSQWQREFEEIEWECEEDDWEDELYDSARFGDE